MGHHGPFRKASDEETARPIGFRLCPQCGELRSDVTRVQNERRAQQNRDARANRDPHDDRCGGTPVTVSIGHQDRADTLRLAIPGIAGLAQEGVTWAGLAHAIVQGARRLFDLDDDDIEARALTRSFDDREEVLEIVWVDTVLGGSGILPEMASRFPEVARSALQHLQGHDCPSSCYLCLRTYRNQRVHRLLNWRLIVLTTLRCRRREDSCCR